LHSKNLATNGGTQDFVPYGILLLLDVVINVKLEGILSEVGSYRISSMLKADGWVKLFVSADIVKNLSYNSESINVQSRDGYVDNSYQLVFRSS